MIHVVISKKDTLGPDGKVRVIGLEKQDMETLVTNGIITLELPAFKLAFMYVSVPKPEFIAAVHKEFGIVESDDPADTPAQ